jgi:hypothetical protein
MHPGVAKTDGLICNPIKCMQRIGQLTESQLLNGKHKDPRTVKRPHSSVNAGRQSCILPQCRCGNKCSTPMK